VSEHEHELVPIYISQVFTSQDEQWFVVKFSCITGGCDYHEFVVNIAEEA